ncbi:hypothetical protein FGSG_09211 [Fusarium graminearum PH-1]|uniref:Chromosome 4, complete genome n=1 Tax=Gibberella zeae (strain ATCC MYA-4620 / CBS 123657 / FGSC 9075 / NRRL 31084 / PH-1) TaxID=229533 RepID=I1RXY4_GIBZE|nr:hypothetical protein FGSG_09211 [Fusarium graminearum PH-1]ESU15752.1 hypothetical protein FGSG_09211 [Fusarium graminearum PH-1]CEF85249.1 unnamed protein product [Fusarium graminearum]|eukprot:XP_011328564.1 hypothetical protein FGSG_09211 [Fusarium graminearum PH-1]
MSFIPSKIPTSGNVQERISPKKDSPEVDPNAQELLLEYLANNSDEYRRVRDLRKKGWENSQGDEYFKKQRQDADGADEKKRRFFYYMMKSIALDLDLSTGALTRGSLKTERVLDMCAAPGGFIDQTMVMCHDITRVRAMSLPQDEGGHEMRLRNKSVNVEFRDITMLAGDMGVVEQDIPDSFPERDTFVLDRVFQPDEKYDLVFCDGQVLRTQQRSEWRKRGEATRLQVTELALGLEHLRTGGTMIILMHMLNTWRSFKLIHQFSKIADVSLYKHHRHHRFRSSFYLVAKNVQAESSYAKSLVKLWKDQYKIVAFGSEEERVRMHWEDKEVAQGKIDEFGAEFIKMGHNIWKTQADGLENAPFIKGL